MFLLTVALVWLVASLVHELSHGLTAQALGGRFNWLSVWPGIQLWPHLGQPYQGEWGTAIAKISYTTGPGWTSQGWQEGLVWLMGSGINLLLAGLALGALWLFRPQGWLRYPLMAEVLMLEDVLLYATLPELLGVRHYIVFGGRRPEPVDGAAMLGCPRYVFVLLTIVISAMMLGGLVAYVLRGRVRKHPMIAPA